jgi:hypothetical protein
MRLVLENNGGNNLPVSILRIKTQKSGDLQAGSLLLQANPQLTQFEDRSVDRGGV